MWNIKYGSKFDLFIKAREKGIEVKALDLLPFLNSIERFWLNALMLVPENSRPVDVLAVITLLELNADEKEEFLYYLNLLSSGKVTLGGEMLVRKGGSHANS